MARKKTETLMDRYMAAFGDKQRFDAGLGFTPDEMADAFLRAHVVLAEMASRLHAVRIAGDFTLSGGTE